jgi:hypothetical protein
MQLSLQRQTDRQTDRQVDRDHAGFATWAVEQHVAVADTVPRETAAHNFSGGRALGSRYVLGLHAGRLGVTLIWNVWFVPGAAIGKHSLWAPLL